MTLISIKPQRLLNVVVAEAPRLWSVWYQKNIKYKFVDDSKMGGAVDSLEAWEVL